MGQRGRTHTGSLTVVGIGFKFAGHATVEACGYIEHADKVLLMLADEAAMAWAADLNPTAQQLPLYTEDDLPIDTYQTWMNVLAAWQERILTPVRQGLAVCVVFHGHPGIGIAPIHETLRQARREGYPALMLPGLSAADCLFADLGVDPLRDGCQLFEATDYLIHRRAFSTASALVLWQIGMIGAFFQRKGSLNRQGLRVLVEVLQEAYGTDHDVILYEAALYPIVEPVIVRLPLRRVPEATVTELSTLYVPPKIETTPAPDPTMLDRLGIPPSRVRS